MTRMRTATEVTDLAATLERQRIADGVHDVVIQRFPMVPHAVIAALTADAVDWLKQAGDVVTVSAVRPLVVESLELRLRQRTATATGKLAGATHRIEMSW